MTKIYHSILDTIGETPIVKLKNMTTDEMAQIYVKLESFNPGGSVKDRIALRMIEDAEKKRQVEAWNDDHRTNIREYWYWFGNGRRRKRLSCNASYARDNEY